MHPIHTTQGFIIHSRPYGEAGKLLLIFTQDFGLVLTNAQGIRLEKSKLRPFIQDYSFGIFSLVKGKELWRLTSAQSLVTDLLGDTQDMNQLQGRLELMAKIALLLKRLLQGEEPHPELFEVIISCRTFLDDSISITNEQLRTLESLIVLRMVRILGYVGKDVSLDEHIISNVISVQLLDQLVGKRVDMNQHINKALKESHL